MRKQQKRLLEDFVQTLFKAHEEIRKSLERKDFLRSMELLEQCQQGAIQSGTLIERIEGEGCITVGLLEDYCELLYQFHEELKLNQPLNENKMNKIFRKQMIQIENSIREDVKVQIEAVFLPYKASMWDSMESIWKAADEDPDCNAYVVPIPYFDKNPDGSFKEMHYEGDLYPKTVPVVSYETYDIKRRQPDIIFIHNPYDDANFVTSVHPSFYSKNLKRYTEKLIYIPYFVLSEISSKDQETINKNKHFITVPGVFHSDIVVVQSEEMRKIYIDVLTATEGESSREDWKKRIWGLGSPKIDKVLSTKKEDLCIPEDWMPIIRKADGSWKKIVFYNTTLTMLLEHGKFYIDKIEFVLNWFEKNDDDYALLWRPHPLIQATIKSMRPELNERYEALVKKYQEGKKGIYDLSADLHRAVAISDAYYGDVSSVMHLYLKTGKPALVQDCEMDEWIHRGELKL